jgi:ABC-type nitrate/sulfonate/bicarbonate transport system permease component
MIPLMVDLLQQQFDRIKKDYRDPIVIYGSSTMDNLLKVFIPLSLESFLTLCRSAVLLGLKVVVSSEVLVSIQVGLGRQLQYARFDLDMNRLFAITIWVILIAVGVTKVFDYLIDKSRY